jgi:hypothetical protein
MPRDYEESDLLKLMGAELVKAEQPHLKRAKIAYVMKKCGEEEELPRVRAGKHPKFAKAKKVPPLYGALTGYDFVIEVEEIWWNTLAPEQQTALLDHELTHLAEDEKGWYLRDHDCEEFASVISRHGTWNLGIERVAEAIQLHLNLEAPSQPQSAGPRIAMAVAATGVGRRTGC